MAGVLQPLNKEFQIVGPDGRPTDYFIRWAQQRQIDISGGITAAQAQQLIDDWAVDRDIIAGFGLSGGGNLSADVTIDLDANLGDLNDVDLTTTPPADGDALTYDAGTSTWVPGAGGGAGGMVLLQTVTVTSGAAAQFTAFDNTNYAGYIIYGTNITMATDGDWILFQVSTNGGSSYDTGANYTVAGQQANQATFNTNINFGSNTTSLFMGGGIENTAPQSMTIIKAELGDPASAGYKGILFEAYYSNADGNFYSIRGAGRWQNSAAYNACRLKTNTGVMTGTFRLYGIPRIAGAGIPDGLVVEDEGSSVATDAIILNFQGAGVTATSAGAGQVNIAVPATVTSVALSAPAEFTVSGSPVTNSGTLTFTKTNQNSNLIYAGPPSGSAAAPSFRSLVALDIPDLQSSKIIATNTNNNAPAGYIGEYLVSNIPQGSAVPLTSGVGSNITSLSLGAGDWDIWGQIATDPAASTTTVVAYTSINTVSGTLGPGDNTGTLSNMFMPNLVQQGGYLQAGKLRLSLAATTTVYLVALAVFSGGTCDAHGVLHARRAR